MGGRRENLADLHRQYDGPIEARRRDAALSGRPRPTGWTLAQASRDIDRLALSTVRARACQRAGTPAQAGRSGFAAGAAATDVLLWYRRLGVRTIAARGCLDKAEPA